ncbi:NACHT domain-containing protein [Phytohabitans suffuscus]
MVVDTPVDGQPTPSRDLIIAELRTVRERGLGRLADCRLPALDACCQMIGLATSDGEVPQTAAAIEQLLLQAIARLGGDKTGLAAAYTFGLVRGSRYWNATDRRKAAAKEQFVSVERFRKGYEPQLIGYVADEILYLWSARRSGNPVEPDSTKRPPDPSERGSTSLSELSRQLLTQLGRRRTAYPLDMSLEELAKSQLFVPTRVIRYGLGRQSGRQSITDLVAELTEGRSCLLLGEPGAGKSVTLYWVANECIRAGLIPVVLRAQDATRILGEATWARVKRQAHPRLVLLVDGLDEALESWAATGVPEQLVAEASSVACLITSRTREFEQSPLLKRADLTFDAVYILQDWSVDGEFRDYVTRLSRSGFVEDPGFYHKVARSPVLARLASRPLHARMLTFIGENSAGRLRDSNALYGEYISKLARVAETTLMRRHCQLSDGVLDMWKKLAWAVHLEGGVAATAVDLARHTRLLSTEADHECVRSAVDHIIDARDVDGHELGEFLHYSFYEYLVASYVFNSLRSVRTTQEVLDLFQEDLSREIRHYLVAQIRVGAQLSITRVLKQTLTDTGREIDRPAEAWLSALNLIVYVLSRSASDSVSLLEGLLDTEQSDFLQVSTMWALCHLGSDRSLRQFYERLETSPGLRSQARGYSLYYYGDLDRDSGPPYVDEPPFCAHVQVQQELLQLMQAPEFQKGVKPQRKAIDLYVFMDILAVRGASLPPGAAEHVGEIVNEISDHRIPGDIVARLHEMLKDVSELQKGRR